LDAVAATGPKKQHNDALVAVFQADNGIGSGRLVFFVALIDIVLIQSRAYQEGYAQ